MPRKRRLCAVPRALGSRLDARERRCTGNQNTEAEAHEQLDAFVAAGGNFVDTAELYPIPPGASDVVHA